MRPSMKSMASISSTGCRNLRNTQIFCSSSSLVVSSSRRVPERLMLMAGDTNFLVMRRRRDFSGPVLPSSFICPPQMDPRFKTAPFLRRTSPIDFHQQMRHRNLLSDGIHAAATRTRKGRLPWSRAIHAHSCSLLPVADQYTGNATPELHSSSSRELAS